MRDLNESTLPANETAVSAEKPRRKKKKNKGGALARFFRRTLLLVFTLLILALGGLAMLLNTVFTGPSETARNMLTLYLSKSSATEWIPGIFLGEDQAAQILKQSGAAFHEAYTDPGQVVISTDSVPFASGEETDVPANEEG